MTDVTGDLSSRHRVSWPALNPIARTDTPACRHQAKPQIRDRGGGMNVSDTLRAAAHALSDRTDLGDATALAGLLQNRADDMERNIAIWRRTGQDVPALIAKYYGVYLTVARAVLSDPYYGLTSTVPSPERTKTNPALQRRK